MQVRKRDFQHFLIPLALSGFVVAYAYDDRWNQMTILQFFRVRLIRLHPLVLVGATFGLLFYLFDPLSKMMNRGPLSMVLLAYLASLLLLPSPPIAGQHNESQALNGPAWSLMQEYLGNIAYAFILRRLRLAALGIIFVVSGLGLIWAANAKGSRDGGWDYPKIWMAPLCLPVFRVLGLWLYRIHSRMRRPKIGLLLLSIVLVDCFQMPQFPPPIQGI
jgi:peptidoglycan/LPS O-acetylase OafA/YrhL